jgi:hypothetical protein
VRAGAAQVYTSEQVRQIVELFLVGADRGKLDPILDACVAVYRAELDEDGQVGFKGKAKVFCRTYSFLSSVISYSNAEWEKLSIMLNLLTPKLPAPVEQDPSKGILEAIDMDSYYAVPGHLTSLGVFRDRVLALWWRTIRRRSQKHWINWTRTLVLAQRWLPQPRALPPFPDARFAATHPR